MRPAGVSRYVLARLLLQSNTAQDNDAIAQNDNVAAQNDDTSAQKWTMLWFCCAKRFAILEALRDALRRAGIFDTLLENADCIAVYALTAERLPQAEAQAFLEQTGWPPLTARFNAGTRDAAE